VEEGGLLTSIVDADEMNAIWEMIWGGWWSQIIENRLYLDWIFIGIIGNPPIHGRDLHVSRVLLFKGTGLI
jgi:hypothetical protein